jgi:hypothetical protein
MSASHTRARSPQKAQQPSAASSSHRLEGSGTGSGPGAGPGPGPELTQSDGLTWVRLPVNVLVEPPTTGAMQPVGWSIAIRSCSRDCQIACW